MASVSGDFKEGGRWTATASSFSGNQTVSLSADVNPLSKVRAADLTISAAGVSKSCTVSLTQEASEFEAKLTVVAIPAFAAGGGTYDSVDGTGHVVVKRNGVVIVDNDVRPVFLFKEGGSVSWITFSVTNTSFTVANRALGSGGSRSVTIRAQYTLDVGGVNTLLECDVPISQAANFVETVSVSDASFAYSTIAAKGATVTPSTDSTIAVTMSSGSTLSSASAIAGYTYALTPSFSMTNGSGFTLNSTTTGSLTAASMGTTLGSRQSPTITYSLSLTYTPSSELSALGAKTVSGSDSSTGTATQGVNEITYSDLTIKTFSYFDTSTVLASGGTSVPRLFATETQTYTSGSVVSDVPVTGGSFALTTSGHGASVDSSTGVVTYASRGSVAGDAWSDSVTWTLTSHDLTATKSASVSQEANVETFVDYSNAYAADPSYAGRGNIVVVTGGTVTATPGVRLSYTSGSTVVKDVSASSTSKPVVLGSGASWDASSWTLTIPSAGTSVYPENNSYDCTIEVTTPYGTTRFYMYRQANLQTLTGIRLAVPSVSGDSWISDWSAVPAAGGNLACAGYNQYSYTSGSTNEVRITDFSDVTVNTSVSWVEVLDDDATYPMSLHVLSRGEIAGDARSSDVSWTRAEFTSNSLSFMQEANAIVSYGTPVVSLAYADIPAGGGSVTPTKSFTQTTTYTSGSTGSISSGGTWSYSGTGVDTSTGAVSGTSLGTTKVSRTKKTDATATITINGKSGSATVGVYQEANAIVTAGPVTITGAVVADIPASGGTISEFTAYGWTQDVTYTSGVTDTSNYHTTSYSDPVTASSLGTTVKPYAKVGTLTLEVVGEKNESATLTLDVYQEANSRTWGTPTITTFEYRGTPAVNTLSAGADNRNPTLLATQTGTWTSGETETASLISSKTFTGGDVNTSTGNYTVTSLGNVVTARQLEATITVNITMNGKTASDSLSLYREANEVTYSDPIVTHTSPISVAASAGQYQLKPNFTQRAYYTSGSETPILSGSFTYAVKTALTGFTLAPPTGIVSYTTNLSVSPRNGFVVTITGSGNGKSGTMDVTFNQEGADPEIYVSLNGTRYGSRVTVNLEGKSASEVSVYVETNDTFDVS